MTAIFFLLELPVFVALALAAAVTRALALAGSLARRVGRRS
jgi:hypothetical protein